MKLALSFFTQESVKTKIDEGEEVLVNTSTKIIISKATNPKNKVNQ